MADFPRRFDVLDFRLWLFVMAIVLYAVFGSPTPDNPGFVELVIALGLVGAVGYSGVFYALSINLKQDLWVASGQIFLMFGITVPFLVGVMSGADLSNIVRDFIPFLFLMVPIFLKDLLEGRQQHYRVILSCFLFLGICFALRSIAVNLWFSLPFLPEAHELTYLENMPSVLFAGLFFMGVGIERFVERPGVKRFVVLCVLSVLALVVFVPLCLTAQRASLGYVGLYGLILAGLLLWRAPYRILIAFSVGFVVLFYFYAELSTVLSALMEKNTLVGFNMRFEELSAVWEEISGNFLSLIFGKGWGASFESPAVAGIRVNFTHSLLSSVLLKNGLCGLVLVCVYLAGLGHVLWRNLRDEPVLVLALAGPLIIDVLFYASFKSLDFGLILLLISGLRTCHQNFQDESC